MADELSDVATKPWTEGPHFWGMDPKVIAHFSFYAMCNYENCQEYFPFTVGLGEEMRKHYNAKHRLYCKACKKDFNSKGELEIHLSTVHRDGVCFMCQASFDLPAPLAMHIESPKSTCYVPQLDLVSALRYFQKKHQGVTDPNAVFSPISCCPVGEHTIQKLKEYRKVLLLAHKKAFSAKQLELEFPQSPASPLRTLNLGYTTSVPSYVGNASDSSTKSPKFQSESAANEPDDFQTSQLVQNISKELAIKADQEDEDSFPPSVWTCSTCVSKKFSSLSKLLQHVEEKAMRGLFKSHFQ